MAIIALNNCLAIANVAQKFIFCSRTIKITFLKPSNWQILATLTIAVLAVSTSAIWIRLAMETANNYTVSFSLFIAASRLILSALVVLPTAYRFKSTQVNPQAFYYAVAAGICLAIHFASWISSLAFTSIIAATTLVTTNPIWVGLLSRFLLKEKLSKLTILGIGIAFVGGILIASSSPENIVESRNSLLGNTLALIGAIMVSLYMMCGTQAQKLGLSISNYILIAYWTAAIALLPLPFLFNISYTGYQPAIYGYIALMAIFPQLIGHTGFNWALRWLSPTFVTLSILFEPIIASALGAVVFQEIPPLSTLWGASVLVGGVAIAVKGKNV